MNAPHPHTRVTPAALQIPPAPFPTQRPAMVQAATAWRETVAHRPPEPLRWHRPATLALALLLAAAVLAQAVAG